MKNIFKITATIAGEEIELFFDCQDRAERFTAATMQIIKPEARQLVKFKAEIVTMVDSDNDVISAFNSIFDSKFDSKNN